ncbi:SEC-C domain-containing protein, partial [Patescibacteria group bacterium]|nr:SEC-C domain-containing protein [Patescibacteria group bacterium]
VIGTERHESRRIDNQLRGRSGRQGDPGSSQFYVSMEDDLMRLFGGDKLKNLMQRLGLPEDQPVEARMVSKSIESAQKKIEGLNFDTRKHVLEYDDVMNKQREIIYKKRRAWLEPEADLTQEFLSVIEGEVRTLVTEYAAAEKPEVQGLLEKLNSVYQVLPHEAEKIRELDKQPGDSALAISDYAVELAKTKYEEKEKALPDPKLMGQIQRVVALQSLDNLWIEHLDTMEHLRDSVGLRGYGQRDPLVEYKREGFELFKGLLGAIDHNIASTIFKVSVMQQQPVSELQKLAESSPELQGGEQQQSPEFAGIGRNDPCPCGSGKKWKKCGLLNTEEHRKLMSAKNN